MTEVPTDLGGLVRWSREGRDRTLAGRVAIVTGSASGIGAATAAVLAGRGATVVVADVNDEGAGETVSKILSGGGTAHARRVDVAEEASVADLVGWTVASLGGLQILHNNAAAMSADVIGRDLDLTDLDVAVWDRTIAVNVRGAMLGCKHALPVMIAAGGGAIVSTSSVAGAGGDVRFVAYGVSKAGIDLLTKCVASRYGRLGIRCNAVAPGMVLTETATATLTTEQIDEAMRHHLTTRPGRPLDIANAVAFLVSDEGAFVNGHVLYVDGGVHAHLPHTADALASMGV